MGNGALERLRRDFAVRERCLGPARIIEVATSGSERTELSRLSASAVLKLFEAMQAPFRSAELPCSVPVLCFGHDTDWRLVPAELTSRGFPRYMLGQWNRSHRIVTVLFNDRKPVENGIIHELSHAFLDCLSGNHPYPLAIHEGCATCMERYVLGGNHYYGRGARGLLTPAEYIGIEELFSAKLSPPMDRPESLRVARIRRASYWLICFLLRLQPGIVVHMLRDLKDIPRPRASDIVTWIETATRKGIDELEDAFCAFCTNGMIPGESKREWERGRNL